MKYRMRPLSRAMLNGVVFILLAFTVAAAFWLGAIPSRYSPFAPLDLAQRDAWFVDLRLAALKDDMLQCRAVLSEPLISATAIDDQPLAQGCGWKNAVRLTRAGEAAMNLDKITCPMAAALAMWVEHEAQPAALQLLGSRIRAIRHMGGYACRNIVGSKMLKPFRSQHATANALDVSAFVLADGRTISVLKNWKGEGPEADFMRRVHNSACRYFRVVIGPDYNDAHRDHFHFDRGNFKSCR